MLKPSRITAIILFLCLSLMTLPACGAIIRDDLLRIHASIVPKTAMMDYDFKEKLVDGGIRITVLYSGKDLYYAWHFQEYVSKKYPKGINGMKVTVHLLRYRDFLTMDTPPPTTIYYLLPCADEIACTAIERTEHKRLIFSYSPDLLKDGAHVSLLLKYKVKPILNLSAIKQDGITLRPAIIKISEILAQTHETAIN